MDLQLIILAFIAGVVSITSPCVFPLIPIVMAGSTGSKLRPLLIVLGMSISFTAMGILTSTVGEVAKLSSELRTFGIVLIVIMGLFLASDRLNNYFVMYASMALSRFNTMQPKREGNLGALILGLSLGVVWIPCVGPVLGAVLTAVALKGEVLLGGIALFLYSLGIGLPMLFVAYLGKFASARFSGMGKYNKMVKKAAGIIIVLAGIALLLGLDRKLQALLSPYLPEIGL